MTQTYDPITTTLAGRLPFILFLAAVLTLLVSIGLLKRYRRAVFRSMRTRANLGPTEPLSLETSALLQRPVQTALDLPIRDAVSVMPAGSAAEGLYADLLRAPWRAAAIYAVAGFCYAFVMATAFLVATHSEFLPLRFLVLLWDYAWPVVLTVNLVAAATWRIRLVNVSVYLLTLVALGSIALARNPALSWGQFARLWFIINFPATVLLLAFLNRRVRAVGPLVLTFMTVALLGSYLIILAVAGNDARLLRSVAEIGVALGLDGFGIFIGLVVLGLAAFGVVGWLTLRWIGGRYKRKEISDRSIIIDAIWLLFGVLQSTILVVDNVLWILTGLLAFVVYKVVAWAGFSLLGYKAPSMRKSPALLLLRVFSLGKRSERLFDALAMHWRYAGSIRLIAGPDLVTTTVEPHEFLDYLSGKLARRFIDRPQTFDLRIAEMDMQPDRDGQFRVNDFFCYDDTWRMVLSRLVSECDAVLMDLRGFSSQNDSCVFEIDELINVVSLGRVVFIIDDTTDELFLRQTMQQSWDHMRPTSPNRLSTSGPMQLFRFTGSRHAELQQLLRSLCVAAKAASLTAA